jgi:PAS domain S-box-containing protein
MALFSIPMGDELGGQVRGVPSNGTRLGSQPGGPLDRLDLFFDLSVDLLSIADGSGNLLRLNPAWERVLGYRLSELYATKWIDLVHPDDRQRTLAEFKRVDEAGRSSFENRYRHKDGSYRWLEWSAIRGPEGVFYAVARDVTERRAERERLRASEAYKSAVHAAATDAIVAFDAEGRVVDVNAAAERTFGYRIDQLVGQPVELTMIPPDQRAAWRADLVRYRKAPNAMVEFRTEHVGQRADGTRFPLELTVARLEAGRAVFAAFVRDLTDVKRAEEERHSQDDRLRQAQKMEAVGRLAGNIAADFQDLLGAVTSFSDVVGPVVQSGGGPANQQLEKLKKSAERASGLVEQLQAFGRRQTQTPQVLDVNATIADLERILRGLAGDDVAFQLALDSGVSPVKADPAQLQQALVNLVINAREAMRTGGRLRVSTNNVDLDAAGMPPGQAAQPGPYVRIAVEDSGVGMTREVASRALEPFFTTKGGVSAGGTTSVTLPGTLPKEASVGTAGLGLSTVYGVVAQSGGFVNLDTAPGRGTTVELYLPAVQRADMHAAEEALQAATVLLVEDEEAVRQLVRRILESRGYKVLLARHGGEALAYIHQVDLPIHLLLTDAVMPVLSGPELLRRAIALRPEMKLAIMSGYTDRPTVTGVPFIGKPFTPSELVKRVSEILDVGASVQPSSHS